MNWIWIIAFALLTTGCQPNSGAFSIGFPPTTEQSIIAQMARHIIEGHTNSSVHMIECQNSYDCAGSLAASQLDMVVDYSALGYMFQRHMAPGVEGSLAQVQQIYKPLGFQWLDMLGFDNGFLLVALESRASSLGLKTMTDLNKLKDGVRIAVSSSYVRQPVTGLPALLRHYGIQLRGDALQIDDSFKRLLALHDGLADIAIIRATDGALRDVSLTALKDNLTFYPRYDASLVMLTNTMTSHSPIVDALGTLKGHLSPQVMTGLNYQVDIEGLSPDVVANTFLQKAGLIEAHTASVGRKSEMIIAIDSPERFGGMSTFAVRVVREVFPDHQIILSRFDHAVEAVVQGKARLALIGADRFFPKRKEEAFLKRENRVEAVAVLGSGNLHLIRKKTKELLPQDLSGTIGVEAQGSERAELSSMVLQAVGKKPALFASNTELVEMVKREELDGALLFILEGEYETLQDLTDNELIVQSLPPDLRNHLPSYFAPVRIPSGNYRGQEQDIDTVGVQIVLAGPSPSLLSGPQAGGPAAALLTRTHPFSVKQANDIAHAIGNLEPPDPILPSVWLRGILHSRETGELSIADNILETSLNIGILLFLGWLGLLLFHRKTNA